MTRITLVGSFLVEITLILRKSDEAMASSASVVATTIYVLKVAELGNEAFKDFVQTKLVEKTVPFHSPLKKQKLKTLDKTVIHKKVTSTENKVVQIAAQRNVFGQMLVLSEEHNVSLKKRSHMHSAQCLGPWPLLMVSLPKLTRGGLNSSISWKMTLAMKTSCN